MDAGGVEVEGKTCSDGRPLNQYLIVSLLLAVISTPSEGKPLNQYFVSFMLAYSCAKVVNIYPTGSAVAINSKLHYSVVACGRRGPG